MEDIKESNHKNKAERSPSGEPKATRLKLDNGYAADASDAGQLLKHGVVAVKVLGTIQLALMVTLFTEVCLAMPEYLDAASAMKNGMVMGGFAALGNPSSFHNELVRTLRMHIMEPAMELFREYLIKVGLSDNGYKVEQLVDRMFLRPKGKKATPENFHRDQSACDEKDIVFGGWINLDPQGTEPQAFSCVTGTHNDARGANGFAKITEAEMEEKRYKQRSEQVLVRPGEWIIFNQNIVHEVMAKPRATEQRRLFIGWRLTTSDKPLLDDTLSIMREQGVPRLPSGQKVPMYAKLHWVNHHKKIEEWSQATFHPELLDRKARKGEFITAIQEFMEPLGLPWYEPYSDDELAILTPRATHKCKAIGQVKYVDVSL